MYNTTEETAMTTEEETTTILDYVPLNKAVGFDLPPKLIGSYFFTVVIGILAGFGNTLTILAVKKFPNLKSNNNICIASMGISDVLALVPLVIFRFLKHIENSVGVLISWRGW